MRSLARQEPRPPATPLRKTALNRHQSHRQQNSMFRSLATYDYFARRVVSRTDGETAGLNCELLAATRTIATLPARTVPHCPAKQGIPAAHPFPRCDSVRPAACRCCAAFCGRACEVVLGDLPIVLLSDGRRRVAQSGYRDMRRIFRSQFRRSGRPQILKELRTMKCVVKGNRLRCSPRQGLVR